MKIVKEKYKKINILDKQRYIKLIKDKFEKELSRKLNLVRVSAPLVVTKESGLQDDLNGVERKVSFDLLQDGNVVEIVQSLAKWKRFALKKYNLPIHKGLYTDMTAIRRDDLMDQTHSIYVDQWDWEKVINKEDRTIKYLKSTVKKIVSAIINTASYLKTRGLDCVASLNKDVYFITSEELFKKYPNLSAKQREYEIVKEYKTVFIMQIGGELSNGVPHNLRAPDYDDWNLNGDLFFYDEVLDMALEVSSMGIRVDKQAMLKQLEISKTEERLKYNYHKLILEDKLPLTIGGGIGQSRLCLLLLLRAHIGEVQSSYWDKQTIEQCEKNEIELL